MLVSGAKLGRLAMQHGRVGVPGDQTFGHAVAAVFAAANHRAEGKRKEGVRREEQPADRQEQFDPIKKK